MIIKPAEKSDLPIIIKLLSDDVLGSKRENYETPLPKSYYVAFENIIRDENQELVVIMNSNKDVIGTLQLTFIPYLTYQGGRRAQIEAVRVGKEYRGKGYGRKLTIVMAYRAYDIFYANNLYNEITKDFSAIEKMEFAHRVSESNLWDNIYRQFPNESKKYRNKLSYYFSMKVLEYSKKLNDKMYFSKALRGLLITHPDNDTPEKVESFYKEELNAFCGSKSTVDCLDFGNKSSGVLADLASTLYHVGLYNDSKKLYQHIIDKINLLIDFEDPVSNPAKARIHDVHFKLGLINLKMNNYYLARQNFVSGSTARRENKSLIEKHARYKWLSDKYFKFRIAECLYKENNFANAIKYFNEAYILENELKEKMKNLSMKALCEYYNNDLDSSKYHFK